MAVINLEALCALYGMELVENKENLPLEDRENVVTKALGVLVENGIYAMSVFLVSCNKPKYGEYVLEKLADLLADERVGRLLPARKGGDKEFLSILENLQRATEDLPKLLLIRKVFEGTLTFARYHCKAQSKLEKAKEQEARK